MKIFKVFPGEHACGPPIVVLVSQSASNWFSEKKNAWKNVEIMPPLFKFLATPLRLLFGVKKCTVMIDVILRPQVRRCLYQQPVKQMC